MTAPVRTLQVLSLGVGRSRRARFLEEWTADLAAAREIGLSSREVLAAAARVAALLVWLRLLDQLGRARSRVELTAIGVVGGLVLEVADVPLAAAVPFVVLVITWWSVRRVAQWVRTGR